MSQAGIYGEYNPRIGNIHGRVNSEDFSIDGRSWNYRDPYNQEMIKSQDTLNERARGVQINDEAYTIANPLYDYSFGQVRDAAKTLGIDNVDKKKEVKSIINHIQNPTIAAATKPKKDKEKNNKAPKIPGYMDPAKPIKLSREAAEAKATISAYNQRFDSPASKAAYDLKDKYSLDLKSGLGQRGQGFKSMQSSGWDNGITQEFFKDRKKKIAKNLSPK